MLQVCLNGARTRADGAVVPITPDELAAAARDAVGAGAGDIHLHPKNHDGRDTMDPARVAAALTAVRAAVPGVPVGVTTGAWTAGDPEQRVALVRSWTVLPDHASVNWHEDGAADVATALLARGIGVEAGIYSGTDAAQRFLASPVAGRVLRILAEVTDTNPESAPAVAEALLTELRVGDDSTPILLHGEGPAAWPVLRVAAGRELDMRIGLEDVLELPDGRPATSNAGLVHAARRVISSPW